MKFERDYEDLLRLLNRHKVRYCIVGAFAVAFHALPRYTKDLDIFISTEAANAKKIIDALEDFGFKTLSLRFEDFRYAGNIVQLGHEPVRIDIVTSIDGCSFNEVWQSRAKGTFGRQKVHYIGLDALIRNTRASARKQDKSDLEILLRARKLKPHSAKRADGKKH